MDSEHPSEPVNNATNLKALAQQAMTELQTIHECWWDNNPSDRLEMIKAIRRLETLLIYLNEDLQPD